MIQKYYTITFIQVCCSCCAIERYKLSDCAFEMWNDMTLSSVMAIVRKSVNLSKGHILVFCRESQSFTWCASLYPLQDIVSALEDRLRPLVQAELSVLVDVLHRPELLFPENTEARKKCESGGFISKWVQTSNKYNEQTVNIIHS